MENEIMNGEEIVEEVTEVATVPGPNLKKAVVIGLTVLAGVVIYKKLIKPAIDKAKARRGGLDPIEVAADEEADETNS